MTESGGVERFRTVELEIGDWTFRVGPYRAERDELWLHTGCEGTRSETTLEGHYLRLDATGTPCALVLRCVRQSLDAEGRVRITMPPADTAELSEVDLAPALRRVDDGVGRYGSADVDGKPLPSWALEPARLVEDLELEARFEHIPARDETATSRSRGVGLGTEPGGALRRRGSLARRDRARH